LNQYDKYLIYPVILPKITSIPVPLTNSSHNYPKNFILAKLQPIIKIILNTILDNSVLPTSISWIPINNINLKPNFVIPDI